MTIVRRPPLARDGLGGAKAEQLVPKTMLKGDAGRREDRQNQQDMIYRLALGARGPRFESARPDQYLAAFISRDHGPSGAETERSAKEVRDE